MAASDITVRGLMRICLVGPKSCPPIIGGIEVFVYEVGRKLVERGVDVTVIVPRTAGFAGEELVEGMRVIRVRAIRSRSLLKTSMIPQVAIEASRIRPDIFHANDASSGFVGAMHLGWERCILTVHGIGSSHSEWPAPFRQGGILLQRLSVNGAAAVVTTDDKTASMLRGKKGDTKIIPSGVDISQFSQGKHPRPRNFEFGKINILHVGRLARVKGTDTLIESLKLLSTHTRNSISLKFIGDGPLAPMVAKAVSSFPFVEWLGEIPHSQIAPFISNADLLVMPSKSEGLPITMLEAMSCRIPVVSTVVGGIGSYFDERHLTKIAEPTPEATATAIEAVVRDNTVLRRKATEAKALIDARFSWNAVADQYMKLYEEILASDLS